MQLLLDSKAVLRSVEVQEWKLLLLLRLLLLLLLLLLLQRLLPLISSMEPLGTVAVPLLMLQVGKAVCGEDEGLLPLQPLVLILTLVLVHLGVGGLPPLK